MQCLSCQNEVADTSKFCRHCGAFLEAASLSSSVEDAEIIGRKVAILESIDQSPTVDAPVERYQLIARLGRGSSGQGVVYKAHDRRLNREVAIKRLRPDRALSPGTRERFLAEARAMARLNHYNIVRVHEVDEDAQGIYIVMECIDGQDLGALIHQQGKLDPERAIEIVRQVCNALSLAHSQQILHRDIKPANILIDGQGVPKLVDFGLAQMGRNQDITATGVWLGTPAYASPEQRRDAKHVDHRTDIYSLGATLYEMVSGRLPDVIRPELIPEELRDCILRAMSEDPEHRPSTADQFSFELAEIVAGDANLLVSKADDLFADGDLERAHVLYRKAVRLSPQNTWARQQSALIDARIEAIRSARREANQAATGGHWDRAAQAWERVLHHVPGDIEAREQLAKVKAEIRQARLGPTIDEARQALDAKRFIEAVQLCQTALAMDSDNQEATAIGQAARRHLLKMAKEKLSVAAQCYHAKDYRQARDAFDEALELIPADHPDRASVAAMQRLAALQQQFVQAKQAVKCNQFELAAEKLREADRIAGDDSESRDRVDKQRKRLKELREAATAQAERQARAIRRRNRWRAAGAVCGALVAIGGTLFYLTREADVPRPTPGGESAGASPEPIVAVSSKPPVAQPPDASLPASLPTSSPALEPASVAGGPNENRSPSAARGARIAPPHALDPLHMPGSPVDVSAFVPDIQAPANSLPLRAADGEEVCWTGELKWIRYDLGETHLVVDHTRRNVESEMFEAFTRTEDFLWRLSAFGTEEDGGADTVTIVGVRVKSGPRFRAASASPLVELREVQKLGDPASRVIVNGPSEKAVVDPVRNWMRKTLLLKQPVTPLTLQAEFRGYKLETKTIRIRISEKREYDVQFLNTYGALFTEYRPGDAVELTFDWGGNRSRRPVILNGKSIAKLKDSSSLVTSDGRGKPVLDLAAYRGPWCLSETGQFLGWPPPGKTLKAAAVFESLVSSGPRLVVRVSNLLFLAADARKTTVLELVCSPTEAAKVSLSRLTRGQEVLFEVHTAARSPGREVTSLDELIFELRWLAPLERADEKIITIAESDSAQASGERITCTIGPREPARAGLVSASEAFIIDRPLERAALEDPARLVQKHAIRLNRQMEAQIAQPDGQLLKEGKYHGFIFRRDGKKVLKWTGFATGKGQVVVWLWQDDVFREFGFPKALKPSTVSVSIPLASDKPVYLVVSCASGEIRTDHVGAAPSR